MAVGYGDSAGCWLWLVKVVLAGLVSILVRNTSTGIEGRYWQTPVIIPFLLVEGVEEVEVTTGKVVC